MVSSGEISQTLAVASASFKRRRRSTVGWTVGMVLVTAVYVSFWLAFDDGAFVAMTEGMADGVVQAFGYADLSTPQGWLSSTVYDQLGPVLLTAFGISAASRAVTDDERAGLLGLELSQPIPRWPVVLGRLGCATTQLGIIASGITTTAIVTSITIGMDVAPATLIGAGLALFVFVVPWAATAWALAAATGSAGRSIGATGGLAVSAYMLRVLAPLVRLDWMASVSPFHWYVASDPVRNGLSLNNLVRFGVWSAMAIAFGLLAFNRRDVDG